MNPGYLNQLAQELRFDPASLEKVIRLRAILSELGKHPFLSSQLVLKGGTALNLFLLGLRRLSVDIDLNYSGSVDREAMLADRVDLRAALEQVVRGLGYEIQAGVDEHALFQLHLAYNNHRARTDRIEVEVNFLFRTCALPPQILPATELGDEPTCFFPVLAVEELMAGKAKALLERAHPRDLYDLFRFCQSDIEHDRQLWMKLVLLFGSTLDREFREYTVERIRRVDEMAINRLLYPLLRSDDRPGREEMLDLVGPDFEEIQKMASENTFLDAMAVGDYRPELLFPDRPDIAGAIAKHPALLWKAQNVAQHITRKKRQ